MSGEGEEDFDKCMAVNVEGTMHLLEALRKLPGLPRIVVAGSMAAMGNCPKVNDATKFQPTSTYGTTKVCMRTVVERLCCFPSLTPPPLRLSALASAVYLLRQ